MLSNRARFSPIPLLLIWLAGPTAATPAQEVSDLVNGWIGHTEEELLQVWGQSVLMTGPSGNMLHIYRARGKAGSGIRMGASVNSIPVGSTRPGNRSADPMDASMRELGGCDVTFEVQDSVVVGVAWSTEGSPDRDAARRTCWREFRHNEAT